MMKLLSFAVLAFASVVSATSEASVTAAEETAVAKAAEKTKDYDLNVELYYEALCPGCQFLIEKSIGNLLPDPCFKDVNWTFVPYGNARQKTEDGKVVTQCQHGELECHRNKEELCTISKLIEAKASQKKLVKVILCMEDHLDEHEAPVKICVKKHFPDLVRPIQSCTRSTEGDKLVNEAAKKTNAISGRNYVPWLMVNGKHGDEQSDLKKQLCKASGEKSKACCSQDNWAKKALNDVESFFGNLFGKSKTSLKGNTLKTCPVEEGAELTSIDKATSA